MKTSKAEKLQNSNKIESNKVDEGAPRDNPRFFRDLFDRGVVPSLAELMRNSLLVAHSELSARDGHTDEQQLEALRGVEKSKLTDMFSLARQIEIGHDISAKLEPCPRCYSKVRFHFDNKPDEAEWRGYVLCSRCKATTNFRGSGDEIVEKWNNGAAGDGQKDVPMGESSSH